MEENKVIFTTLRTNDGIVIGMPTEYCEKIKKYCNENCLTISSFISVEMKKCNYIMSEFFRFIESI